MSIKAMDDIITLVCPILDIIGYIFLGATIIATFMLFHIVKCTKEDESHNEKSNE